MFTRKPYPILKDYAIFELNKVSINDNDQWIYIRGENVNNPILLMLHGGPGAAQIGFSRHFQRDLEKHFIVVQWDQRGAGLSYSKYIRRQTMNNEQFVRDTIKVTEYVLTRLNQAQLYLVAHSWGTIIGMKAIKYAPHLYSRYFGVSQVNNVLESEIFSYKKLIQLAKETNNLKAQNELKRIGKPPWEQLKHHRTHQNYIDFFGCGLSRDGKLVNRIFRKLLISSEYSLVDILKLINGQIFSMKALQKEMRETNLIGSIKSADIPIYFLMGTHDLMTPSRQAK